MWKKMCCFIFSTLFATSSIFGGGICTFANTPTAFADSSSEDFYETLSPGTYITTLFRQNSCSDSTNFTTATEHFSPQAILTINDDNTQSITIGVEHWSLYDAFIPAKQSSNDTGFTSLPSDVFNSENSYLTNITTYLENNADTITDAANDWYNYNTDSNSKFGNVTAEYNEQTDIAYVTFEIADYTQFFAVQGWFNSPIDGNGTKLVDPSGIIYNDLMVFHLEPERISCIDLNEDNSNVANQWFHVVRNSSLRRNLPKGKINYFTKNMTLDTIAPPIYKELVDRAQILAEDNGGYIVNYHLTDVKKYANFKVINSSENKYTDSELWQNWDYWKNCTFDDLSIENNCITIKYDSLKEAIFGKNVYCEKTDSTNFIVMMSLCLNPLSDYSTWKDNDSGIYVLADNRTNPGNYTLSVTKNAISESNDFYIGISKEQATEYKGISYKAPEWYTITVNNSSKEFVNISDKVNVFLKLPDDFNTVDYHIELIKDGTVYCKSENFEASGMADYVDGYLRVKAVFGNAQSIAIMKNNTSDNVYSITEDGIYSADAYLVQDNKPGILSMADAAFKRDENSIETRKVYIYVKDGEKKLYFKLGTVARDGIDAAYVGELLCNNVQIDNEVYWDSVSYTDFELDGNGNLLNNAKYDAVSEWGCIKGGILDLMDECYISEYNIYELAVGAPIMAEIGGVTYEDIQEDPDSLQVWLKCYNLKKCDDSVTLDTILNEGYGYHSSALLRRIKQVETKFASNKGEAKLEAALAEANKVYTAKYEDAADASKAYEAAIAKLDEFEAGYDMTKNLPDGKYIVHADMVQLNRVDPSMSDAAINHDIVVNVKDGKATVQVEFKGLAFSGKFGYLSRLWNYDKGYTYSLSGAPIGTKTEAKVLSKYDVIDQYSNDNPPHYLEFELVDGVGAEWVPLHVYVPVMTGSEDQDVNMHIDWSTARKAGEIAEYTGNTLSLKDDFGLNFFFNFGEQTLNDAGAKVKFTLPDGSVKEYVISEIADADKTANGYKFSANVAAKEMTAPVKVQVILSNGETSEVFSCSVKEYADKLLASSTNESEIALVKSILNYGGYAQEFFGYNKTALANADLTDAEKTLGDVTIANTKREKVDDEDDGINFYGSSLSLNTKIDLKAYFTLEDGAKISDYTFKIGSTELTPVESGNKYYVTIPDITSRDIDERSAIEIANKSGEGELSVKTGPYAYIYKALSKSSDEKLQSLMKALYFYSQAAENYNA